MIPVPSVRLVWLCAAAAALAIVAAAEPALAAAWWLALGSIFALALADLAASVARRTAPRVELPPVLRLTVRRAATVRIVFSRPPGRAAARRFRFSLALPDGIESAQPEAAVELPPDAARAHIDWSCTPRQRGSFRGALACIETGSVLGLWKVIMRQPVATEFRAYANLFGDRKQLAAIFLARGREGLMPRRTIGRGREFDKLREYLPGDGFDEIHWKATAKRRRPVTKVFQAERTQEIYVVLDASRLSGRMVVHDGVAQTALERSLAAAFILLLAAERQGDRFGLIVHDDRVRLFLRARQGQAHFAACREAVLRLQPSETTPDVPEIVRHIRTGLTQRALLFFLTDLSDPVLAEDFARHANILSRQHLMFVCQMRADEVAPLFRGPEVAGDDEIYGRLAGHARWVEAQTNAGRLKQQGVTARLVENETMAAQIVSEYMKVKRRQAL